MEPSRSHRSELLTAGGVLSIIAGAVEVIAVLVLAGLAATRLIWGGSYPFPPMPYGPGHVIQILPLALIPLGVFFLGLGVVAVIGGVYALRRKSFGMALAGAICALPMIILGILAVIFVALSRKEFGPPKQIAGGQGQSGSQQPGGQSDSQQPGQ